MTVTLGMPVLETAHLRIRPFVMEDLDEVHRLLDVELGNADLGTEETEALAERAEWLRWTVLNYVQLAKLRQPPYGDRAVILKSSGQLIGACGFVPCLSAFEQLPGFGCQDKQEGPGLHSSELGLFYAISPAQQRRGYGAEAAQALVAYAFRHLQLRRVVATTTFDNVTSIAVMRKLGMRIVRNPRPDPPWLQVVGFLENRGSPLLPRQ
jgi:ribosomal-protein-alanine N-acetyltransferase